MGIDKRKYIRFDTTIKIKYKLGGSAWIDGSSVCNDIAMEGMRLDVSVNMPNGTLLDIELYLATEDRPVSVTAQTAWCRQLSNKEDKAKRFEAGVRFLNFMPDDKNRLTSFLSKLHG